MLVGYGSFFFRGCKDGCLLARMHMKTSSVFLKSYAFSFLLIGSLIIGSYVGHKLGKQAECIKPLGTLFLNMLFTIVVPMVFFSLSSAVAGMTDARRLGRIMGWMLVIFLITAVISSLIMVVAVRAYPPAQGIKIDMPAAPHKETISLLDQIVKAFTVGDFMDILSKRNMLALITFSVFIGLASASVGEKAKPFVQFLQAGNLVMSKAVKFVMYYAPIGLGAWFAYLVGVFGPDLLGSYWRVMLLYYPVALGYFVVAFTAYAWFAAGAPGIKAFWGNIIPASLTAWATGSSVATIPTNLEAAKRIGVPEDIREVIIPIGATIHMEGSCLAAIVKIAVLFGLYNMPFEGVATIAQAIGIAVLAGVVISGIPAGGMLGELLIVTLYGFPIEAMPVITMIGTLVDPPATMVNAIGDNVSSMMVARIMEGKNWLAAK
jgi:Na+/H+-dicarboxylate symporter